MAYHQKTLQKATTLCTITITIIMALLTLTTNADPPKNSTDKDDQRQGYLAVHNAAYARGYVGERARDCAMVHSGGPYGENLAWASWNLSAEEASKFWADEKPHYDYASNSSSAGEQCLHYTQMVWRDSVRIGCARAKCDNGWTFVTCNYDPPGNFNGQRAY